MTKEYGVLPMHAEFLHSNEMIQRGTPAEAYEECLKEYYRSSL